MIRRPACRFERIDGRDLLHPFLLKRRKRRGAIFERPSQGLRFELQVAAWMWTPPPQSRDDVVAVQELVAAYREGHLVHCAARRPH